MATVAVLLAQLRAAAHTGIRTYGGGTYGSGTYGGGATAGTLDAPERPLVVLAKARPLVVEALPS
jgi:hypothetical protein